MNVIETRSMSWISCLTVLLTFLNDLNVAQSLFIPQSHSDDHSKAELYFFPPGITERNILQQLGFKYSENTN